MEGKKGNRNTNNTVYKAAVKAISCILLCWPMRPEADVSSMTVEAEPFYQYSITLCFHVTDCSRGADWQNGI